MSRELTALTYLKDLAVRILSTTGSPATGQIGITPHDKIVESDLPFVQVFSVDTENSDVTVQGPGEMLVALEVIDKAGRKDVLRLVLEEFDRQVRVDQSLQGRAIKAVVTTRAVSERYKDDRTFAGATISVRFKEGFPDETTNSLTPFKNQGQFGITNGLKEESKRIAGCMGIRRDAASTASILVETSAAFFGFPLDVTSVQRLRLLLYTIPGYSNAITSVAMTLYDEVAKTNGAQFNPALDSFIGGHGWRERSFDIRATPDFTFGAGWNGTTIGLVEWAFPMFFSGSFTSLDYGLILCNFGYDQRDLGTGGISGVRPGF